MTHQKKVSSNFIFLMNYTAKWMRISIAWSSPSPKPTSTRLFSCPLPSCSNCHRWCYFIRWWWAAIVFLVGIAVWTCCYCFCPISASSSRTPVIVSIGFAYLNLYNISKESWMIFLSDCNGYSFLPGYLYLMSIFAIARQLDDSNLSQLCLCLSFSYLLFYRILTGQ